MNTYTVVVADPAKREIKKLTHPARLQIVKTLRKLEENPRPFGAEKLRSHPNFYRVRSGDYRIIYGIKSEINAAIVLVVRDRKDAFKGLDQLDGKLADALTKVTDSLLERAAVGGSA